MLLRVVRPMKRKESSKHYFRQRIPLDVLDKARGSTLCFPVGDKTVTKTISLSAKEVKVSLQTSDPSIAKTRQGIVAAYVEAFWQSLRNGPITLSHKQAVALSGELFALWIDALEDNPGTVAMWKKVKADNEIAQQGDFGIAQLMIPNTAKTRNSLEDRFGSLLDVTLAKRGLIIDDDSRHRCLVQTAKAMDDVAETLGKYADGDYSDSEPDKRFPKWEQAEPTSPKKPQISMSELLEGWWKEAQVSGITDSTKDSYSRTVGYFSDYLGHDDAAKVTRDDVIAYKDYRLHEINPKTGKAASPKTVKDSDLAALKSVFGWAVANNKLDGNPAEGVTVKVNKRKKSRPNYFREGERYKILNQSRHYNAKGREREKLSRAKRWIPWICAYTGARVGEIAQLRKQDIRLEEGVWIINITPEAGDVKSKAAREVPIHNHLIEVGLIEMVREATDGYLFIDVEPGKHPRGKVQTLKNDLAEFVRIVVPDPDIQPNHGWRHTFRTLAREIQGIDSKVIDDIVGHAPKSVGDRYGESTIKARAMAMQRFPRLID